MKNNKVLLIVGSVVAVIALLTMLSYNFVHTGGLLASYVDPPIYGYIAAFGIELAVVALSVAIGTRKWHGLEAKWLGAVLISVLVVSFLANVAQGHLQRYKVDISTTTVTRIDLVQGIIGLAATGLISLIVFAMSEIAGQYIVQLADTEPETEDDRVETVYRSSNGAGKMEKAKAFILEHPDWSGAQVATAADCTQSTVSKAKRQLRQDGQLN